MQVLEYEVSLTGISPQNVQVGGVQGDHNNAVVEFTLTQELLSDLNSNLPSDHSLRYHVEVTDGSGGFHASELLTLDATYRTITYPIPREVTIAGGIAHISLVASDVGEDSHEDRTLYARSAKLEFIGSSAGTDAAGTYYGEVNGALDALLRAFPVDTEKIKDGAVTTPKLADNAVTSPKIADSSIKNQHIQDYTIQGIKLSGWPGVTVTYAGMDQTTTPGIYAVDTGAVLFVSRRSDDNAVIQNLIDTDMYVKSRVSYNAVTPQWGSWFYRGTVNIQDGSITTAKLANGAVTGNKIAEGALTLDKLSQSLIDDLNAYIINPALSQKLTYREDISSEDQMLSPGVYQAGNATYIVFKDTASTGAVYQIGILPSDDTCMFAYRSKNASGWTDWENLSQDLPAASTSQAGIVQLNNTLTSTSATQALTAAQGKALKDMIDDIPSGGGGGIPFGVCTTAGDATAKTVTLEGFTLEDGAMALIQFGYGNTSKSATLNINGTGAKPIMYSGSTSNVPEIGVPNVVMFVYDNGYYFPVSM